jgi:hypothetical protein
VLRPADIEIETEIVVLSTFWPVKVSGLSQ